MCRSPASFIYITGCDGTGKTTQAQLLLVQLLAQGVKARVLWLRFPFFISIPLLAYARLKGYSWIEVVDGVRHGYWDFRSSWLMKNIFPWFLLVDATLASLIKIYFPMKFGSTIICERFVLDMLVDLAVATQDMGVFNSYPGMLFIRLLPTGSRRIALELDGKMIQERRADLKSDRKLTLRIQAYQRLCEEYSIPMISSQASIKIVQQKIMEVTGL